MDHSAMQTSRQPLRPDERFWLWFWAIVGAVIVLTSVSASVGVILTQKNTTAEQICAARADPPEFCRELAKSLNRSK